MFLLWQRDVFVNIKILDIIGKLVILYFHRLFVIIIITMNAHQKLNYNTKIFELKLIESKKGG